MAVVVRLQVTTAEGCEQAREMLKTLDFEIGVEGVPECEVISVLMAAVARILVTPVTTQPRQSFPLQSDQKLALVGRI